MSNHSASSSLGGSQRKAMRKGTRSCFECRRRKIRCIFEARNSAICAGCKNRGSLCVEQSREQLQAAVVDSRLNLKNRVTKLEAIIESITSGTRKDDSISTETLPNSADSSLVDQLTPLPISPKLHSTILAPDNSQSTDPILSLFNNAIWQSNGESSNETGHVGRSPQKPDPKLIAKRARTCEEFLSHLPPVELIQLILDETCSWWHTWCSFDHWELEPPQKNSSKTLSEFVIFTLQSKDPSIVSMGVLSICVSLKHLSDKKHNHIICQLSRPPAALFKEYFELVETLIVNDSDFTSTREGIEVILMFGKMLMNLGLLKKTWILVHRAISYCQLIGLHRALHLSDKESDLQRRQRHYAWVSLCELDAYLSLLLGLPNASHCRTIPAQIFGGLGTVTFFRKELMNLSVQVIDMHQMGMSLSVEEACHIQLELESAALAMQPDFWNCQSALKDGKIPMPEYMESITAQLWYYQLRVSLHMPLMIKSVEVEGLESHRLCCLQASRDLLKIYHTMRLDRSEAFSMNKPIDYQAFICATLLVLGVLGYGNSLSPTQSTQQAQDRDLIDETLNILRRVATSSNNQVASQACRGLETMSALANNCPDRDLSDYNCGMPFVSIAVPHSGTIIISPGPFLKKHRDIPQPSGESHREPAPVFALSSGGFPYLTSHAQYNLLAREPDDLAASTDQTNPNLVGHEFASIDLDWGSLTNMNTDEDWAWLNDANGMTGYMSL